MNEIQLPIARPPWTGLGKQLESCCRKALYEFEMLEGCSKVAIALSGGKDSLTLLYLLHAIRNRGFPNFEIIAIHVNGEYSCGAGVNENWLAAICKELEVKFLSLHADQKRETLECYSCSRKRRNLIFEAAKNEGATTIAFGHHRDDHAQTLLMNLLQKGEFAGNLPKIRMHKYGVTIIRPLIYISEQQIRTFAKQNNFARITCQCPVGQNSMRKRVDHILTQLEEEFPNTRENVATAGFRYGSDKASRIKRSEHD